MRCPLPANRTCLRCFGSRRRCSARRLLALCASVSALLLVPAGAGAATSGSLDASFGNGGVFAGAQRSLREGADAVAVQGDGRIVYAGLTTVSGQQQAMVGRLTRTGSPDPTFSGDGFLAFAPGKTAGVNSIAIGGDGRIYVGGVSATGGVMSFFVARLTSGGALDPTFGSGGVAITPIGTSAMGMSIAIQANGRIVEAGSASVGGQLEFAAVRYGTGGVLDPSFGSGGKVTIPVGSRAAANGVAVQGDGRIDLAGEATVNGLRQFAAVRLTSAGVPDTSFGTRGTVVVPDGAAAAGTAIALQTDGRILLAGGGFPGYPTYAAVRLTPSGALDSTFGSRGVANVRIPGGGIVNAMALQGNGKVVLGGVANVAGNPFGLVRLNANGSPDLLFGALGIVTNLLAAPSAPNGVAIAPDGKIVVAGGRRNADGTINTLVARLVG